MMIASSGLGLQVDVQKTNAGFGGPPLQQKLQAGCLPPFPREILENLDTLSVEMLCALGRELVAELLLRVCNLFNALKMNAMNHQNKNCAEVELLISDNRFIISALVQVRLRIDLERLDRLPPGKELMEAEITDDEIFNHFSVPEKSRIPLPEKDELSEKYENNRVRLIKLDSRLKKLDWLIINSDPRMINKGSHIENTSLPDRK